MQAKSTIEHELVRICLSELCKKAGFADSENLVQRDLLFLSESIESKTGVLISLSTIRRLLNGQFSRLPQIATLDAIAMFLGYQNWQDFKFCNTPKIDAAVLTEPAKEKSTLRVSGSGNRFTGALMKFIGVPLILIAMGLLAIMKIQKHRLGNLEKAHFTATKTTGNDLPNTVIFSYNIDSVSADSFFIQQSWDKNRRVKIFKNTHTLTDIYYEPGYHIAKLIANDQIIKTIDVSIPTDRWLFYAQKSFGSRPQYIFPVKPFQKGYLQLAEEDLINNKIDIQNENQYLLVYFPSRIQSNSDNFKLRFKIRVNELKNDFCPYFMAEVFCQRNFMYFKSTLHGCISELGAQFGENYLSGKTNDFSALGTDVHSWNNVELVVKNRNVGIRLNNTEVFSTNYDQPCGLITGLGFISDGLCEVDSVDLRTIDGNNIYSKYMDR
jgi:hypothetical protein